MMLKSKIAEVGIFLRFGIWILEFSGSWKLEFGGFSLGSACFTPRPPLRCRRMRLLDRYLLRELLVPLGYCLSGFVIFWVFADLFTELNSFQSRKLRAGDIAE